MSSFISTPKKADPKTPTLVPHEESTIYQRCLAFFNLQCRLQFHFPTTTLSPGDWARVFNALTPDLVDDGDNVEISPLDLIRFAQHLSDNLPVLDPPLYGRPARLLATYCLRSSELAIATLQELAVLPPIYTPSLCRLLNHLVKGSALAEQVVQAWCWDLLEEPLPAAGVPGGGPAPGSPEAESLLSRFRAKHG